MMVMFYYKNLMIASIKLLIIFILKTDKEFDKIKSKYIYLLYLILLKKIISKITDIYCISNAALKQIFIDMNILKH